MSNYLAIATVTAAIQQIIQVAAAGAVDDANVTTERPSGSPGAAAHDPEVHLFLFQAVPNPSWRNGDLPTRRPDGTVSSRPLTAVDLHYLLTFYGDESDLEPQRLMGVTLSALSAHPVLSSSDISRVVSPGSEQFVDYLESSDLQHQVDSVRLSPLALDLEEMSKLWSVFFQTPYALSTAYQASVALIEAEIPTRPSLPVKERRIYSDTFRHHTIEKVLSEAGENAPVLAGGSLVIAGRRLQGEQTTLSWDGAEVPPTTVSATRITVELSTPPIPTEVLRAGVHGVQVVHSRLMGNPPEPHRGVESNIGPFVLRPTITAAVGVADVETDDGGLRSANLTIQVSPDIGSDQAVFALLYEAENASPSSYSFPVPPRSTDTDSVTVGITGVQAGDYLVRIRVDGADSPLEDSPDPGNPTYVGPLVTIP